MFVIIPTFGRETIAEFTDVFDAIKGYLRVRATTPCLLIGDDGTLLADSRNAVEFVDADAVSV